MVETIQILTALLGLGCDMRMDYCKDEPQVIEQQVQPGLTVEDVRLNNREAYIVPANEELSNEQEN